MIKYSSVHNTVEKAVKVRRLHIAILLWRFPEGAFFTLFHASLGVPELQSIYAYIPSIYNQIILTAS